MRTYKKTNKINRLGNNEIIYEEIHTEQIITKRYFSIDQLEKEKSELQNKINDINIKLGKMRKIK